MHLKGDNKLLGEFYLACIVSPTIIHLRLTKNKILSYHNYGLNAILLSLLISIYLLFPISSQNTILSSFTSCRVTLRIVLLLYVRF